MISEVGHVILSCNYDYAFLALLTNIIVKIKSILLRFLHTHVCTHIFFGLLEIGVTKLLNGSVFFYREAVVCSGSKCETIVIQYTIEITSLKVGGGVPIIT